jgi:hypothetical protein
LQEAHRTVVQAIQAHKNNLHEICIRLHCPPIRKTNTGRSEKRTTGQSTILTNFHPFVKEGESI